MTKGTLYRYAAFARSPEGGNPAGVWVGEELLEPVEMQRIAAEVGYSETAFVAPTTGAARIVRYYSPEAEVSFCGHATIATGVVLGETAGEGTYYLATQVGEVPVAVRTHDGVYEASLTSVEPTHEDRTLIGVGGYKGKADKAGTVEIGYAIIPAYRGQGLATEAARGLIDYAFADIHTSRVDAHTLAEHNASTGVLERVGMVHVGIAQDEDVGHVWHWSVSKEAYRKA